jgi:hypothetical protein
MSVKKVCGWCVPGAVLILTAFALTLAATPGASLAGFDSPGYAAADVLEEVTVEPRDFGGDGKADVLIRHDATGQLYLYEMDGNLRTGSNIGALSTDWEVVGLGDLGGDGKADIVIRHTLSGQLYLYEMDGNLRTGSNIGALSPDWEVVGLGDLGGDGKADIVIRHALSGQLYLYEMDGNLRTGSNIGALGLDWDVVGLADLGGDGMTDIVIRDTFNGQLYLYEMDGNVRTGSNIGALSLDWVVVGIRDLGGDGKADILIRHDATGQLYLYEMDGNLRTGSNVGALSVDWSVVQLSDFGGDGKADILIRHDATGQLYLFEMDGNLRTGSNVGGLNLDWVVQPPERAPLEPVDAVNDISSTRSDLSKNILVLANDLPAGVPLTIEPGSVTSPTNGTATLEVNNTITYRHASLADEPTGLARFETKCESCHGVSGFTGVDSFGYTATDGVSVDNAVVTVSVTTAYTPGNAPDLSGYSSLSNCAELVSLNASKHAGCLGLTDADVAAIGRFLGKVF